MLSRLARVARTTSPCCSWARMPNQIASGAYQTSTSVGSSAGWPSTGWYCEKPVSLAAVDHTGSSRGAFPTPGTFLRGKITGGGTPPPAEKPGRNLEFKGQKGGKNFAGEIIEQT